MIEPVPLTTAQKTVMGLKNNRLKKKKRMKRGNLDVPRFQYKVTVLFHLKLKNFPDFVSKSSEQLQDKLLTKLLGQFIELHTVLFSLFLCNILGN